jgi:aspartate/methionine/tyrosine aminotransferase
MQPSYLRDLATLEEMRARVYRRRNARLLDPCSADLPHKISVCEGGCLFPAHPSLAVAATNVLLSPGTYPSHIYPQQNTIPDFLQRVARFFSQECQIPDLYAQNVTFATGISQLFDAFIAACTEPGDIILAPESYYHGFVAWPHKWGVSHLGVPTRLENGFKLTAADLDAWFLANPERSAKVKALLLTSPTTAGAVYTRAELEALAEVVACRQLLVFVDEVFRDTVFSDAEMVSLAAIPAAAPYCVTAHSGAKGRSAANFRIGWACGPADLIGKMQKICDQTVTEYPFMLQSIGQAILDLPADFLQSAKNEWALRAMRVRHRLALANARLRRRLGLAFDLIEMPLVPQASHSLLLRMENLRGALTPKGRRIATSIDLAEYLLDPSEGGNAPGVVLSVGASKGHRELICYYAFSQTGHEYLSAVAEPLLLAYVQGFLSGQNPVFTPDYSSAIERGRKINDAAVDRIEAALGALSVAKSARFESSLPVAAE